MSDIETVSGAVAPKRTQARKTFERRLKKGLIKLFFDADLKPELSGTYTHHIHKDVKVPWRVMRLWKKRGFNPVTKSIAHVRFGGEEKKYTFPAYFKIPKVMA